MKNETSRRDFLGISALGLAAAVTPKDNVPPPAAAATAPENQTSKAGSVISIWVTFGDERFAPAPQATWSSSATARGSDQIQLNLTVKFQEILGFGVAFTDATCYTFNQL